jgi:hypothetical protein
MRLMIYVSTSAQRRILEVFHNAKQIALKMWWFLIGSIITFQEMRRKITIEDVYQRNSQTFSTVIILTVLNIFTKSESKFYHSTCME